MPITTSVVAGEIETETVFDQLQCWPVLFSQRKYTNG